VVFFVSRWKAGTRMPCSIGYFVASALAATAASGPASCRAIACRWGPVGFPRLAQGAIHTCGKLRMRLALPVADQVRIDGLAR